MEAGDAVPPAAPAHPAPVAGDDQDRKKRQRLERNKECARECRRRKRDHTAELEARVAALEAENNHLQLQVQADGSNKVAEEADEDENEMAQMLAGMDAQEVPVHEASWLLCASWNRGVLQLRQEQPASTRFVAAAKWLQLGLELVAMPCLTVEHARYKEAMTRTFQEVCQFTPCSPHTRNYLRFLT